MNPLSVFLNKLARLFGRDGSGANSMKRWPSIARRWRGILLRLE